MLLLRERFPDVSYSSMNINNISEYFFISKYGKSYAQFSITSKLKQLMNSECEAGERRANAAHTRFTRVPIDKQKNNKCCMCAWIRIRCAHIRTATDGICHRAGSFATVHLCSCGKSVNSLNTLSHTVAEKKTRNNTQRYDQILAKKKTKSPTKLVACHLCAAFRHTFLSKFSVFFFSSSHAFSTVVFLQCCHSIHFIYFL